MTRTRIGSLLVTLLLSACVTINIYFPAAQAQEAAEAIVEDILQKAPVAPKVNVPPEGQGSALPGPSLGERLLDFLVPAARAAQPDFNVDTPEVRRIQAGLKRRHAALAPYFASGAIGFTQDGRVAVRDQQAVPLKERGRVKTLVAQDNDQRDALYRAIAAANGHPEWEGQVRSVFARTWIDKAGAGWYYRNAQGQWVRK
jgi:uncharacterized protein YdbL (DUF1318 family)